MVSNRTALNWTGLIRQAWENKVMKVDAFPVLVMVERTQALHGVVNKLTFKIYSHKRLLFTLPRTAETTATISIISWWT